MSKNVELCPDFQIFTLNKLTFTSALPLRIKELKNLPKTAIFLVNFNIPLNKYLQMGDSDLIKSSDSLIFHPLTPAKNLEYLKQQWKENSEDRPRFLDNKVNIYLDNSFFEYLITPSSHVIDV